MATAKSPLAAPSPRLALERGNATASYFPQQSHYQDRVSDAETLSNTLANSHVVQPDGNTPLNAPVATRPNGNGRFTEEWDASQRGSSVLDPASFGSNIQRSNSFSGSVGHVIGDGTITFSRGNTLKKKASLRGVGSLKRSSSRRSMKAGSVRSLALQSTTDQDEMQSAFYCPVPTAGSPTEALANRFQGWRKLLKDLIACFREIQTHYEHRAKSLNKLSNVLDSTSTPPGFLASGGLDAALQILRSHNKQAIAEANRAREIEEDVILALTGLRSDLHQKIKEIKNLSGDFKNSVEKEMETTRRAVNHLQEVLGQAELNSALTTGKQDPYLLRLAVDRQLERQIGEENYLHQAYLNLENSGRELESIVVGEIQKSYNAYAGILKRESDAAYGAIEELRNGPISMRKDTEWASFIHRDDQFVDPDIPMRSAEFIHYPGRDHYACQEIRAGLLERKSKYLKSYAAGWYVLSPTHLHEFRSADKTQAPLMSLYLPEQKLGSHSVEGGSSNKFVLKGRQTGSMHRGHTWVFRAESHDTMMAWYDDIRALTERTPEERSNFVRGHIRSLSRTSQRSSMSSDGIGDDDEEPPFAASPTAVGQHLRQDTPSRRPSGGRFQSEIPVNTQRDSHVPLSPRSVSSGYAEHIDRITTAPDSSSVPRSTGERHRSHEALEDELGEPQVVQVRNNQEIAAPTLRFTDRGGGDDLYHAQEPRSATPVELSDLSGPVGRNTGLDRTLLSHPTEAARASRRLSQVSSNSEPVSADHEYVPSGAESPAGSRPPMDQKDETKGTANGIPYGHKPQQPRSTGRNENAPTISHLHIPGEYPKGSSGFF